MTTMTLAMDIVRPQSQEITLAKLNRKSIRLINSMKLDNATWNPVVTLGNLEKYRLY